MSERPYIQTTGKWKELADLAKKYGGLEADLWNAGPYMYPQTRQNLMAQLGLTDADALRQVRRLEDFWNAPLKHAVDHLVGRKQRKEIQAITGLLMQGQYSSSIVRRSFRSRNAYCHVPSLLNCVARCIRFTTYEMDVCDMLSYSYWDSSGVDCYLALKLSQNDVRAVDCVKEAILGDNSRILLTTSIIRAIILSGHKELLELLCKLLTAARMQEGLRQQILEQADAGSLDTFLRIWKVCLDEDLFRYSSFVRALGTWTGFSYENMSAAKVKQYAAFAYECLTDEHKRYACAQSENNLEAYYALWAIGCHEAEDCDRSVQQLLTDSRKYRRILGWYFVSNYDSSILQMQTAVRHLKDCLQERDEETMAWVIQNLAVTWGVLNYGRYAHPAKATPNAAFPADVQARRRLFGELNALALAVGSRKTSFTGNPFSFSSITLEVTQVISCMMSLAFYDFDIELCLALHDVVPYMNADQKKAYYTHFCQAKTSEKGRQIVLEGLNDRAVSVKTCAAEILADCRLSAGELTALADALQTKSSGLRKSIIEILKKQDAAWIRPLLPSLLRSQHETQIQAAIELLLDRQAEETPDEACRQALAALKERRLSTQTTILLDQLLSDMQGQEADYCLENGYGLYDPAYTDSLTACEALSQACDTADNVNPAAASVKELAQIMAASEKELAALYTRMSQVFDRHADYEYEVLNWQGTREKVLFGSMDYQYIPMPADTGIKGAIANINYGQKQGRDIRLVPFAQEFLQAMGDYATDPRRYLTLYLACGSYAVGYGSYYQNPDYQEWFKPYVNRTPCRFISFVNSFGRRFWQMRDILLLARTELDCNALFGEAFNLYRGLIAFYKEANLSRNCIQPPLRNTGIIVTNRRLELMPVNLRHMVLLRQLLQGLTPNDSDFKAWFLYEHRLERLIPASVQSHLELTSYAHACEIGLIRRDAVCERLIASPYAEDDIRMLTRPARFLTARTLLQQYPWMQEMLDQVTSRIADLEEKRGESPTPMTALAMKIARLRGAGHFVNLLAALGKENFFRGYEYTSDMTKQSVLSHLLKCCYPGPDDTPETLSALLCRTDISDNRLAEAVMYAPQWAGLAEKILGWQGLKMGVWFFHAHINEKFSAEKETEVAIYSPITPLQFNDGAFDKDWFLRAYGQLGEKRFRILYKSAKYITAGSSQHRRSQLYTDAVLGRLNASELKQEITEKRNQEKLRCYPLIPLGKNPTAEALARYEFIQKFSKESRQFGSQRRESEKKACRTALENLSITMGFTDVNRMMWFLESEKLEEIRPLTVPQTLGDIQVYLEIAPDGDPELIVEKQGKRLKSLPKAWNKHETVLQLKETVKELRDQKSRARKSLEQAMVDCTAFSVEELVKIAANPILSPMLFALVWMSAEADAANEMNAGASAPIGFLTSAEDGLMLIDIHGTVHPLSPGQSLRLAHPHDLMQAGVWSDYMHRLYALQLVQPFKQVFREYYPLTEEERQEKNVSRRYAGHQVQPQKTVALLKGRGWTVDYEEGLQKVCYRENIIVRMYALADWFSPADIEPPTLEVIHFYDRNTGELLDLEQIPPILFSEAMRDMDLAVSVAHAGGVDPEASHSTVEMRIAIAGELVSLMKLSNVTFAGSHAKIQGRMANYSVHMGSGVVHGEGIGMIAILPVHSQSRGRIFLPFADDDPKTAEIMSKIILLSEDQKIKDPSILRQIRP